MLSFTFSLSKINWGLQHVHANPVPVQLGLFAGILRVCGHERSGRGTLCEISYCVLDISLWEVSMFENVIGLFGTRKILRGNVCYLMRLTHVSAQGPQDVARTIYLDVENVVQDTLHKHLQYTIHYLTQTSPRVDSPLFSRSCSSSCFDRSSSLKLCFIQNFEIRVRVVRYLYCTRYHT
jgi:hypothetical protein